MFQRRLFRDIGKVVVISLRLLTVFPAVFLQFLQLENTFASRAQQVLYELQDSDRKIRLYRDTIIPKVKEMVAASETAYQAGSLDFLNLIDSQRTLIRYQLEYERVVADNGQRLAELEMLMGIQFPER